MAGALQSYTQMGCIENGTRFKLSWSECFTVINHQLFQPEAWQSSGLVENFMREFRKGLCAFVLSLQITDNMYNILG